jgi:hypothetical protein
LKVVRGSDRSFGALNDTFGGPSAGDLVPGDLMTSRHSGDHLTLARAHGLFNVLGGLWPLVHMPSFEAVLGPKTDRWLVKTVAGLMVGNGWVQLRAASSGIGLEGARRIGLGTALTLGTVDVVYGLSGQISRVYFVDAVFEAGWIMA